MFLVDFIKLFKDSFICFFQFFLEPFKLTKETFNLFGKEKTLANFAETSYYHVEQTELCMVN